MHLTRTEFPKVAPSNEGNDEARSKPSRNLDLIRNFGAGVVAAAALFSLAHIQRAEASPADKLASEPALIAHGISKNAFEATPANPVHSARTSGGNLIINNKPVFPFGVWSPEDGWAVNSLGANLFIDVASPDLAQSVFGKAWVLQQDRPTSNTETRFPNSIGGSWLDEPEEVETPEQLSSTPNLGGINFENFRLNISDEKLMNLSDNDVVLSTEDGRQINGKTYKEYIKNLGPNAIITFDFYPVNANGLSFNDAVRNQFHRMIAARKLISEANPNATPGCYIETTKFADNSAELTPNLVIAQAKACIAGGARFIGWWDRLGDNSPDSTPVEIAAAIKSFSEQIHSVSPVLLGENMKLPESGWESPLKIAGRIVRDQKGNIQDYGIILLNSTDKPLVISQHLPGLSNQTVKDAWSGKLYKAHFGTIKATVGAGDWIILTYNPGQTKNK